MPDVPGEHQLRVRCLVDINVFEDVFRKRNGWRSSERVIRAVRRGNVTGFVSALTPAVIYFLRQQRHPETESRRLTRTILRRFRVISLSQRILGAAFKSAMPDFEDAIQFESALSAKCEYVVTRNLKHFTAPEIPALTPERFLRQLGF